MQLLPIFASLEMLELVESPMHSFTTPAGHSFVLRQFDDFLYLGVSDAEPQEFVSMQLVILRDFLNMLYGPVTALLRPSAASVRLERWKATARLMSTVAEMRKKEQCYLVQAIEIIRINPFVRRICGEAMEQALSKQRGGQIWGSHALLLVGTKLLALYSVPTAPDLQSSDLFLLGLFVQDVLGRDSVPGMEMPDHPPQHTSAVSGGGGGGGGGAAAAAAGGEGGSNGSGAGRRGRLASNAAEEDPVVRTHTSRYKTLSRRPCVHSKGFCDGCARTSPPVVELVQRLRTAHANVPLSTSRCVLATSFMLTRVRLQFTI